MIYVYSMNHFFKVILIFFLIFLIFFNSPFLVKATETKGWKGIIIKEVFPNPEDKDFNKEWIKIYNNSNKEINLKNWLLIDVFGTPTPFLFKNNLWLEDDDYLIISREESNIILNNFKETLNLFTPDGDLADQITYINAPEKKVYTFNTTNNFWSWENEGASSKASSIKNKAVKEKEEEMVVTTKNWAETKKNEKITIEGIVLTLPNQTSSQYFFLSSDNKQSQLFQIYSYKKDFPTFTVGEKLKISGTVSETSNWKRLKTSSLSDFINLEKKEDIIIPELKNNLIKDNLGKIFSVQGIIKKVNKNSLKINYNNDSLVVNTELLNATFETENNIKLIGQLLYSNNNYYLKALPNYSLLSQSEKRKFSFSALLKKIPFTPANILLFILFSFFIFFSIKLYNTPIKRKFFKF